MGAALCESKPCCEEIHVGPDGKTNYGGVEAMKSRGVLVPTGPPTIILHNLQKDGTDCAQRLKWLLSWAVLSSRSEMQILDVRIGDSDSIVPALFAGDLYAARVTPIVGDKTGLPRITELVRGSSRILVCAGVLELTPYLYHDLSRCTTAELGLVPALCGSSGRSGELQRADVISHLEEVLSVKMIASVTRAAKFLLPNGPKMPPRPLGLEACFQADVKSKDNTELTEEQVELIHLLLPENVVKVNLTKIGAGFSSALKFFLVPQIAHGSKGEVSSKGSTTFIKIDDENELEAELKVTHYMMQLLGNFCPQVLGYSELGGVAALHLSLADMGAIGPTSFHDVFGTLACHETVVAATADGEQLLDRLDVAIDFVFGHLVRLLHASKVTAPQSFSLVEELGFCKDLPGGRTGAEEDCKMSSGWVLEKLWKKKPGDGGLASSVLVHMKAILGDTVARADSIRFHDGHAASSGSSLSLALHDIEELPNVCTQILEKHDVLKDIASFTNACHARCYVHGDLHGDNIMMDEKNNIFLIDFGKTSLGHSIEDVTWLESFVLLSYVTYANDEDFLQALSLVRSMAPKEGLTVKSCKEEVMRTYAKHVDLKRLNPRISAIFKVVIRLRHHLADLMKSLSEDSHETISQACACAAALLLRNSLFFMAARENRDQPRRRRLALAFACAYGEILVSMCHAGVVRGICK